MDSAKKSRTDKAGVLKIPPRPIRYKAAGLAEHGDSAIRALQRDADVYVRGGRLVHVVTAGDTASSKNNGDESTPHRQRGAPTIHDLERASLRSRLTRIIVFERFDKGAKKFVTCGPVDHLVDDVLTRKVWPGIRPLSGIAEAPFMRPDGSICDEAGYDEATGFLYAPNETFPPIPSTPTQRDAVRAFGEIEDFLCDFNFRDPWGPSVVVAAILALVGRPAVDGCVPAFVLDANIRGAGKSRIADFISTIATGRPMPRKGYPHSEAELAKVLDAFALLGGSAICLDNVDAAFGGAQLDLALTTPDQYHLRVLGKSEVRSVRWQAVIFATGNNLSFKGDTNDRVLQVYLLSKEENPRARTGFKHQPFTDAVREARPRLVVAALTILRAFVVAGRPEMKTPSFGSFEGFSSFIPPAVVFAGGHDPMQGRILGGAANPVDEALGALLAGFDALVTKRHSNAVIAVAARTRRESRTPVRVPIDRFFTSSELVAMVYADTADDGAFAELRVALDTLVGGSRRYGEERPNVGAVGKVLATHAERRIGGRYLRRREDLHLKISRWSVCSDVVAGDAGDAGDLNSREKNVESISKYRIGEKPTPAAPAPPAPAKRRSGTNGAS
jgi:hypothetical protein